MVTVTINIKPYLAGYMYVRYRQSLEPDPENQSHSSSPSPSSSKRLIPIHLSHITPVYHFLHQLSVPHPQNTSWKEIGNICFVLPKPRNGKNPEVYNYIGNDSALIIEKEIETEMKAELYSFLLDNTLPDENRNENDWLHAFGQQKQVSGLESPRYPPSVPESH